MSWPNIFPVFEDELIDEYLEKSTEEERRTLEQRYGVERIFNQHGKLCQRQRRIPPLVAAPETHAASHLEEPSHVVSLSLFWQAELDERWKLSEDLETMFRSKELGLTTNSPWDDYVEPILREVPRLRQEYPEVVFRIYLAQNLAFLVDELVQSGCEVYLMKGSSLSPAPGILWRLLALSEPKLITVINADRIESAEEDIIRTRMLAETEAGAWRAPVIKDYDSSGRVAYRPFDSQFFGLKGGDEDPDLLLRAFTWHFENNPLASDSDFDLSLPDWPQSGFNDSFMTAALYPRLAQAGIITVVPWSKRSNFLLLDVEYVTWANPSSELILTHPPQRQPQSSSEATSSGLAPEVDHTINKERFGSAYGGWDVLPEKLNEDSIVYSFGIGDDISFDLALIERFSLNIHAFDPTPKSIEWLKSQNLPAHFTTYEYGIAERDGTQPFYSPEKSNYISHSIVHNPSPNERPTMLAVKRLSTIMEETGHAHIDILKLDVEGAEYGIIEDLERSEIRPSQILIEFHHRFPELSIDQTRQSIECILSMGYRLFSKSPGDQELCFYKLEEEEAPYI